MKHKRFKIIGIVVLVVLAGLAGWYGWQQSQDSDKNGSATSAKGTVASGANTNVTFSKDASLDDAAKSQILEKVINPMTVYHTAIIRQPISTIKVSANKPMNPNDYRFKIEYGDGPSGFLFGANQKIGYWIPPACDDDTKCKEYLESFKKMLPASYEAYQACEAANKAQDKEKANLVCAP